jgi:hypothetical protein
VNDGGIVSGDGWAVCGNSDIGLALVLLGKLVWGGKTGELGGSVGNIGRLEA